MAVFNVDSEQLAAQSAQMQGTISRIQSDVNQMHSGLQSLQGVWGGQASSTFQSLLTEWRATQLQVEDSLARINEALRTAAQVYAEAEAQNAALFG